MVIPLGKAALGQSLRRITRTGPDSRDESDIGGVRFVPLIGVQGWTAKTGAAQPPAMGPARTAAGHFRR